MTKIAPEFRYSEEHEWVANQARKNACVCVSAIATESLGEILYLELPEVGSELIEGTT